MESYNNSAKIHTGGSCGELRISINDSKQTISATNNRAKYYSDLAERYKDEAKEYRDNAQYYAEQNSDVTYSYIDSVKSELNEKINRKQDLGDYAFRSEIPINVGELVNDMEYTTFDAVIPEQFGNEKKVLYTNGENLYWDTPSSYNLFDIKLSDHILGYAESEGWALQGTYVYKEAVAGSRYGYPDFYNKVVEEFNEVTTIEIVNGVEIKVHSNGHKFYDIANKLAIDEIFNTIGSAWFYGIDIENERIFLPRNNYFEQVTGDVLEVGQSVEAGLPNITGKFARTALGYSAEGCFNATSAGSQGFGSSMYGTGEIDMDASRSSSIYGNSDTVQPNAVKKLLYICVGNITSYKGTTEVVNQCVEILEQVNQGIESRVSKESLVEAQVVIETYQNGSSGYRIWSDGYCEQWGITCNGANQVITLLKPYISNDYVILVGQYYSAGTDMLGTVKPDSKTQTGFTITGHANVSFNWQTSGYIK